MQVSLTMAHICNSFSFLVFHLFRADAAKPFAEAKNLTKKQSEFSHGRTLTNHVRPRAFQAGSVHKMPSVQMLNAHCQVH